MWTALRSHARLMVVAFAVVALGTSAAAEAGTLTGHVRDQSSAPIPGASVEVLNPSTAEVLGSDVTTATGTYTVSVADGTYDVRVTPPASTGLGAVTAFGIVVSGTTTLDFALMSSSTTTVAGRLLDAANAGIPFQSLQLIPEGGEIGFFVTTDASGHYSFPATPGSYFLVANGDNQNFTAQGPQAYSIQTSAFAVDGSAVIDLHLPVRHVTVHVQDSGGNPVAGVGISTTSAFNCELVFGPASACGSSNYTFDASTTPASALTDGVGNVTVFLFPTPSTLATSYAVTATPPPASGLGAGSVSGIQITGDTSVTMTLAPPTVLTGRLLDGISAGIPFQFVELIPDGQDSGFGATTDAAGGFAFPVQPGAYRLSAFGDNQNFTASAPQSYALNSSAFSLSANQSIDFQLPVRRVDVHVQDAGGAAVPGAGLSTSRVSNCSLSFGPAIACGVSNYEFSGVPGSGVTDAGGNIVLWLFPTPPPADDPTIVTSYRFTAIPPSGSGLAPTGVSGIEFTSDTTVTITLATPATLSGRLLDGLGAGVPFQFLEFAPEGIGGPIDFTTDATGNYSIQAAPGSYRINAFGDNQNFSAAAPQFYSLNTDPFSVSGAAAIDLTLPVKRLAVHVQDPSGSPISSVGLSAFGPVTCGLAFGPSTACGSSFFFYSLPLPGDPAPTSGVTDAGGDLTLWLFPTAPADPSSEGPPPAYSITALPLSNSGFDQASVQGLTLTDNATLVIVLGAAHAAPVTTLSISPSANGDGTYPDPVTITLAATAADGFTIDATFYAVDGGPQQPYFGAFVVAGPGPHVIRFLSSDSGGIAEAAQFFNFTIANPDAIPPTTTATVTPPPNGAGWNKTNVTVGLSAVDNPGGSGVAQLTYSISGAQATPATVIPGSAASIVITTEGVSTITFYAADLAGNIEAAKTVTVRLDRTAPEAYNQFDPVTHDVALFGRDSLSGVPAGPIAPTSVIRVGDHDDRQGHDDHDDDCRTELRTYDVQDRAGNVLDLVETVQKCGHEIVVHVVSLQYGSSARVFLPPNEQTYKWSVRGDGSLKELDQDFTTGQGSSATRVDGDFDSKPNTTKIVRKAPEPRITQIRSGLVLLRMATSHGTLQIEY